MAADKIVAEPGTITGSIGVLGGKMVPSELWEKIGLSFEAVQFGKNAGFFSMNRDYTPEEWARLQAWLDRVYEDFTSKVAQGRKLDKQRVLEIAKGRVWTGEDAERESAWSTSWVDFIPRLRCASSSVRLPMRRMSSSRPIRTTRER